MSVTRLMSRDIESVEDPSEIASSPLKTSSRRGQYEQASTLILILVARNAMYTMIAFSTEET